MKLNKKHGVNPTIPVCFCGKEKNEVVLLGAAYKEEAPMKMFIDFSPCDECKKKMKEYIALILSNDGKYPEVGSVVWIKKTAWSKVFNTQRPSTIALIDPKVFHTITTMASNNLSPKREDSLLGT